MTKKYVSINETIAECGNQFHYLLGASIYYRSLGFSIDTGI